MTDLIMLLVFAAPPAFPPPPPMPPVTINDLAPKLPASPPCSSACTCGCNEGGVCNCNKPLSMGARWRAIREASQRAVPTLESRPVWGPSILMPVGRSQSFPGVFRTLPSRGIRGGNC